MSRSSETSRYSYAGNGVTTVFSFPQPFVSNSDIVVMVVTDSTGDEVTKTITTHYTLTGAGGTSGGNVTMISAPASGETLVIYRDPSIVQDLVLDENAAIPVDDVVAAYDKLTDIASRLSNQMSRAVRAKEGHTATFDFTLPPNIQDSPNVVVIVNSNGDGFDVGPTSDQISSAQDYASQAATSETNSAASEIAAAASAASALADATSALYRSGGTVGGTADVITLTPAPALGAYASGQRFVFTAAGTNTTNVTVNISGLGAKAITTQGLVALAAGNIISGQTYSITYDGTRFICHELIGIPNGAVVAATLNVSAITGQSADTSPASDDSLLTYDTSAAALKKVTKANLLKNGMAAKTTTYTATAEDDVITVSASSGWTLSLPTAVGIGGKEYTVVRTDDSPANLVTIDPNGSETIGGFTTVTLATKGESWQFVSDNANWQVLNHKTNTAWSSNQTLTINGCGTVTSPSYWWQRNGDTLKIRGKYLAGTVAASTFSLQLPSGFTIDSAKLSSSTNTMLVGMLMPCESASGQFVATNIGKMLFYDGSTTDRVFVATAGASFQFTKENGNTNFNTNDLAAFTFEVPISNWYE